MSGDDHGHGSGHGHDSHSGPSDIIAVGSWQDKFLALVAIFAAIGLSWWGMNFQGLQAPVHGPAHHAEHGESAAESEPESSTHGEDKSMSQDAGVGTHDKAVASPSVDKSTPVTESAEDQHESLPASGTSANESSGELGKSEKSSPDKPQGSHD